MLQIAQQRVEPVDFRGDHARHALVFECRGNGEERRGRGHDSLDLSRELQGGDGRRHAKLNDALQSVADLQEGVHSGGGRNHSEHADAEER